jgi:hypothetical protein
VARERKPFELEYSQVEVTDARERISRAFAILLAAGRRHRQQQQAGGADAVAASKETTDGHGCGRHGERVVSP